MTKLTDKLQRALTTLSIMHKIFRSVASSWPEINWYKKHRYMGLPSNWVGNEQYLKWFINDRNNLFKFREIHKGEDCFIIGNGPSLNKTDLDKLKDHHVFGLNKIHLIFDKYPSLKLSYHVIVNPLVIEQVQQELNNNVFKCPIFLSFEGCKDIQFSNPDIHKLFTSNTWSFYLDIAAPISEGYTVTYVAMQIAFYMGFKNVYLVGVDHNFKQTGRPNEEQNFKGDDHNHFHPDYFKGMQWHLADLEGNEASYAMARHQYHRHGREIYDATIDGKLQIFQKISFDEAVMKAKKRST